MGTNYYWIKRPCPKCGQDRTRIHIGKSSHGWHFQMAVHPELNINTLADWIDKFTPYPIGNIRACVYNWVVRHTPCSIEYIVNEYGDIIKPEEMINIITCRHNNKHPATDETAAKAGGALGIKGLVKSKPEYCVGYGDGTWDYVEDDFS